MLRNRLQDHVARTHVVHQETAVRMEYDRPQRGGDCECATVDLRSSWSGGQGFHVAGRATDLIEQMVTPLCSGTVSELRIARRSFGGPNEAGEMIDVREAVRSRRIIRLCSGVAKLRDLIGLETVSDAHFVEVRIGGEREQARMLVFPAKPAHAHLSGSFYDGNLQDLPADFTMRRLAFLCGKID